MINSKITRLSLPEHIPLVQTNNLSEKFRWIQSQQGMDPCALTLSSYITSTAQGIHTAQASKGPLPFESDQE